MIYQNLSLMNNKLGDDFGRDYFRYGSDSYDDCNILGFKVVEDKMELINV